MSGYWEVIAPLAVAAMAGVVVLARRLRHPPGGHRAQVDDGMCKEPSCPNFGGIWHDCPQFKDPPRYGSMILAEERALDYAARGDWTDAQLAGLHDRGQRPRGMAEPLPAPLEATLRRELHHVDDLDLGPGAGLPRSPGYNSHLLSGTKAVKVDSPAPDGLPREEVPPAAPWRAVSDHQEAGQGHTGAGDESEGSGLTAPPAPLWEYRAQNPGLAGQVVHLPPVTATDLANARLDAFMAAMRADHARWMPAARERWAAA